MSVAVAVCTTVLVSVFSETVALVVVPAVKVGGTSSWSITVMVTVCTALLPAASLARTLTV